MKNSASTGDKKTCFVDGHVNPLGWVVDQPINKEALGTSSISIQMRLDSIDTVIDAIKKVPEGN